MPRHSKAQNLAYATKEGERSEIPSQTWLITGATGLLGANAAIELQKDGKSIVGVSRKAPVNAPVPFVSLDLGSAISRKNLIRNVRPDVILHCAALASHESCEDNPKAATEINTNASRDLAEQAAELGAKYIYISTDAVFDGEKGNYAESDEPSPTSVYGKTKLEGEYAVLDSHPEAIVARVNFFGWSPTGKRSLSEYFLSRLNAGEHAPGFTDVIVSTLYVGVLINRLRLLLEVGASGVFNVANDESITKFKFGRLLAKRLGANPDLVTPARSSDILELARGADLSLDTTKMVNLLKKTSNQREGIEALFSANLGGRRGKLAAFQ